MQADVVQGAVRVLKKPCGGGDMKAAGQLEMLHRDGMRLQTSSENIQDVSHKGGRPAPTLMSKVHTPSGVQSMEQGRPVILFRMPCTSARQAKGRLASRQPALIGHGCRDCSTEAAACLPPVRGPPPQSSGSGRFGHVHLVVAQSVRVWLALQHTGQHAALRPMHGAAMSLGVCTRRLTKPARQPGARCRAAQPSAARRSLEAAFRGAALNGVVAAAAQRKVDLAVLLCAAGRQGGEAVLRHFPSRPESVRPAQRPQLCAACKHVCSRACLLSTGAHRRRWRCRPWPTRWCCTRRRMCLARSGPRGRCPAHKICVLDLCRTSRLWINRRAAPLRSCVSVTSPAGRCTLAGPRDAFQERAHLDPSPPHLQLARVCLELHALLEGLLRGAGGPRRAKVRVAGGVGLAGVAEEARAPARLAGTGVGGGVQVLPGRALCGFCLKVAEAGAGKVQRRCICVTSCRHASWCAGATIRARLELPLDWQLQAGHSGAGGGATGVAGQAAWAPRRSAVKLEQKPEGMSQAGPAQPQLQEHTGAPSSAAEQRPLGPQSMGQPKVACHRIAAGQGGRQKSVHNRSRGGREQGEAGQQRATGRQPQARQAVFPAENQTQKSRLACATSWPLNT